MMPTAARLVAATLLALLAWIVSDMVKPLFPDGTTFGSFNLVNGGVAFVVGWNFVGPRAERGIAAGISNGFTGAFMTLFCVLAVHGTYEMTKLSMRHRYDGFLEAFSAVFTIGTEYLMLIATVEISLTLFIGGCLVGLLTELASRRWS